MKIKKNFGVLRSDQPVKVTKNNGVIPREEVTAKSIMTEPQDDKMPPSFVESTISQVDGSDRHVVTFVFTDGLEAFTWHEKIIRQGVQKFDGQIHIDDWLDKVRYPNDPESYAAFVLEFYRMPAVKQMNYAPFIKQFLLFCTYQDQRWRVVFASRLGHIGLTPNQFSERYQIMVNINECTGWSSMYEPPVVQDIKQAT